MSVIMRLKNRRPAARRALLLLLVVCCTVLAPARRAAAHDEQDVQKLNRYVQGTKADTPAMKLFREGRDQIEAGNWAQAADRFSAFVRTYPGDKDVDAALYWLAYARKRQGDKESAAKPLLSLIRNYPGSTWRREAEAMLVELGYQDAIKQALDRDNDEIKILALQSLFEADEERAYAYVGEILKPGSTASPALKSAAVALLGARGGPRATPILLDIARNPQSDLKLRLTAIRRLGEQPSDATLDALAQLYEADRTKDVRVQILRAYADMRNPRAVEKLTAAARAGDDLSVRQYAIRFLADREGPAALDELIRLYDADRTPEIRAQILRSLADRDDPRARAKLLEVARRGETTELRVEAIRRLADRGATAVEDLLQLYATETDQNIRLGLIRAYADMKDPRARAKLSEIARTGEPAEVRLYAIRRLGDRDDAETVNELISMYDGEQNVQVRGSLLRAFGDSKQKPALRKLMQIARSDQNVELRKLAVRLLGESKDPEALKFLEDLLK
ncbi:MAG TPA: HEAT repeat domain-containing protein [Pyrinomonadaceae bacterium]|jgi:HEAT repeat protein